MLQKNFKLVLNKFPYTSIVFKCLCKRWNSISYHTSFKIGDKIKDKVLDLEIKFFLFQISFSKEKFKKMIEIEKLL